MRRTAIITAALLVSAAGAHAAAQKPAHHPTQRRMASSSTCIANQRHSADQLDAQLGVPRAASVQRLENEMRTRCLPKYMVPAWRYYEMIFE